MAAEWEGLVNRPRTKRGRVTLNNILSAAAQVIYEKGYHAASIHDITSRAGVAAGTFYIYFDGKYNLYKFLLLQCSHKIRRHLYKSTQGCTSRREVERVGMRAWLDFVQKNPYMYHVIWESLYIDKQLFVDYYVNFCKAYMRGLRTAADAGEIKDIDEEVLAYTLMGATNFLGLNWGIFKQDNSEATLDRVTDEFMRILDAGIFRDPDEKTADPAGHEGESCPRFRFEVDEDDEGFL